MYLTKRSLKILGSGVVLIAIGHLVQLSVIVFALYNISFILLLIIDYAITSKEQYIELDRGEEDRLSLYQEEKIQFIAHNKSPHPITIEMMDEVPPYHFEVKEPLVKAILEPNKKETLGYQVIPKKRGAFQFGNIHVRYISRLGLFKKGFLLLNPKEYKVYPDLKNMKKYRLHSIKQMMNHSGMRNLALKGSGTDFESLREYVVGDDYRKINWKATARKNKPIVNDYNVDKNQHIYMFIDTGRAMSYEVKGYKKLDLAINTSLTMSNIINDNGDLSGLLVFNTKVDQFIKPGKGIEHHNKIMNGLYHVQYNNSTSHYNDAFQYFMQKESRRSLICIFTDFETMDEAEEFSHVLTYLSKKHLVLLIFIENDKLLNLVHLKSEEDDSLFYKGVALDMLKQRKKLIHELNRKGIRTLECPAEKITLESINAYIRIKDRMLL